MTKEKNQKLKCPICENNKYLVCEGTYINYRDYRCVQCGRTFKVKITSEEAENWQ